MEGYTISERLEMTIGNIEHQQKKGLWDDEDLTLLEYEIEKLKEVLERVKKLENRWKEYLLKFPQNFRLP
jgi:hypothetical protein